MRVSHRVRRGVLSGLGYVTLTLVALIFLIPFVWLIVTSLKPMNQVFTDPLQWIPKPILWSNYVDALTKPTFPYLRLLANTIFYALSTTVGAIIASSLAAYAFARMDFLGKNVLFLATLSVMMLPAVVTLIPMYVLYRHLGWTGTWAPLIAPAFLGYAFYIFLLRQFFMTVPWDLTDAARVDGAGDLTILVKVMLPLVKPVIMVIAVMQIMYAWNDFFGPLIYLSDRNSFPLALGLNTFRDFFGQVTWNLLMAATLATAMPMILLFFVAQRYFIEGITLSGIKG
jgi:ABC-type glycerol-3-phosphate transport system permease component